MSDSRETIVDIIASFSAVDRQEITLESNLKDIEIESLEFVELVFKLEEEFDIEIPYNANEAEKFQKVEDVVVAVEQVIEDQKS